VKHQDATAFSMRDYFVIESNQTNLLSRTLQVLAVGLAIAIFAPQSTAVSSSDNANLPRLVITDPGLIAAEEGVGLETRGQVSVSLSAPLVQAIERGVTLSFVSEFVLVRPRWWWWDDERFRLIRTATLTFHPVTRQFRVTIDGSKPRAFLDLTEALKACLALNGWRVWPDNELPVGLIARVRLSLDPNELPKALQVNAITDEEWRLNSGWREVRRP